MASFGVKMSMKMSFSTWDLAQRMTKKLNRWAHATGWQKIEGPKFEEMGEGTIVVRWLVPRVLKVTVDELEDLWEDELKRLPSYDLEVRQFQWKSSRGVEGYDAVDLIVYEEGGKEKG